MKPMRILLAGMLMAVSTLASARDAAPRLNSAETQARREVQAYLNSRNISNQIDNEDQTLAFRYGEVLYWVTFKGNKDKMLYTLSRNFIWVVDPDNKKKDFTALMDQANFTANYINRHSPVKATCEKGIMNFTLQAYYATPGEFNAALTNNLGLFKDIKNLYGKGKHYAKTKCDSIQDHWLNYHPDVVVIEQPKANRSLNTAPAIKLEADVNSFAIQSLDASGATIIPAGSSLYCDRCMYLQACLKVKGNEKGDATIGVKIINPDGKLMVGNASDTYTLTTYTEVDKKYGKKALLFSAFGATDTSTWKPGEYTIEFYDETNTSAPFYQTRFHIL